MFVSRMGKRNIVIGLGEGKTGSTSLHLAMQRLGYHSLHNYFFVETKIQEAVEGNRPFLSYLSEYNSILDSPLRYRYRKLDKQYDGLKYILTLRDQKRWMESRYKHVILNQIELKYSPDRKHRWTTLAPDVWLQECQKHNGQILEFFHDRPNDLCVFEIDKGCGYQTLCSFLGCSEIDELFPQANDTRSKASSVYSEFQDILQDEDRQTLENIINGTYVSPCNV